MGNEAIAVNGGWQVDRGQERPVAMTALPLFLLAAGTSNQN